MSAAPDRLLAAQVHALRETAAFLERAGTGGLSVTFNTDEISILVPARLGPAGTRLAIIARLTAATGSRTRPAPTSRFAGADGDLAGHLIRIFTPQDRP
jgi:hypothetical protein